MKAAFDLGNELFDIKGLTNFTTNTVDIYELHNTIYIVTAYQEGSTLSYEDFSSLKDCISVVKSTATVISKLHKHGYLYLDLKPENIFVLTGTYELVQLFDFDSLTPMSAFKEEKDECEYKISYTKGFSALELKTGNLKKIGKHTDIYAIGAILFYLLFGSAPEAPDCEMDAEYAFTHSRYGQDTFQAQLYAELTEFFYNTLANFYLDRYQDVFQVIAKLEEIEKLADTTIPYIMCSHIVGTKIFVGRKRELALLKQWSIQKNSDLLFVTGIGGIGKSSFVKSFLLEQVDLFDTFLYLNFHHSLIETIADDKQFVINTIIKNEQETLTEYFQRKLSVAARLTNKQKLLLVIDNYAGDDLEGLPQLLKLGWKILIISRNRMGTEEYPSINVTAIPERTDLHTIFMKQENMRNLEFTGGYYLTMAWYYTYVEENPDKLFQYILKAYKVNIKLCKNPLDLIDNFMIPAANILFENDMLEDSITWLKKGIQLCEEHEEILPFARKKMELCCYLQEVEQFVL